MKKLFTLLALTIVFSINGQVGINNENPDASAALDITSTTKGLLIPRMTAAQRQRSIGNPLNRLSITGEDTEYLTRNEVSKVLNVTVQTLNNWRREGVLNPLKIGGRVLYKKEDVYNDSRLVA